MRPVEGHVSSLHGKEVAITLETGEIIRRRRESWMKRGGKLWVCFDFIQRKWGKTLPYLEDEVTDALEYVLTDPEDPDYSGSGALGTEE